MQLTTLGTGSPIPSADRAGPSTLVQANGLNLLFDCGRGVLLRLAGAGLPGPIFLHQVFLTHLHSDHVTDFNDLVTTRWVMSMAPNPLPVIGPLGTAGFADDTIAMLHNDIGYRLAHHDDLHWDPSCTVSEATGAADAEPVWQQGDVVVTAAPTDHRPVEPTLGYRVEHQGRSVVIAGDTVPCDGLTRLCEGADVYVQTVIREDLVTSLGLSRLNDILDYHSTVTQAARTAQQAGVGTLVLTHPVPTPAPGTEQEWVDIAAAEFGGTVVLAHDLWTTEV